ncbi:hypothetical protein KM043_006006 [Ampulex compressa]|nr:hypothetical protein KM043_006006 [Ampulex compressa]
MFAVDSNSADSKKDANSILYPTPQAYPICIGICLLRSEQHSRSKSVRPVPPNLRSRKDRRVRSVIEREFAILQPGGNFAQLLPPPSAFLVTIYAK